MPANNPIQTFKCPSCGAPVSVSQEPGRTFMQCSYCNETVTIPEAMRIPARPAFETMQQPVTTQIYFPPAASFETSAPSAGRRSCIGSLAITSFIVIALAAGVFFFFGGNSGGINPVAKLLFANKVMSFGSEGIGPGMFKSPRGIGVDGNGNIVVADSQDGRVQVFDAQGKFLSTFTVLDSRGKPQGILAIAVSRDGKVYVPNGDIFIYDESGSLLGKLVGNSFAGFQTSVALGPDGTVYALTFGNDDLVHFKTDGTIDFEIKGAVENVTGSSGGFPQLAVDGLGNIYIATASPAVIIKYSPQGKFLDQFGGDSEDSSNFQPGKFISPLSIAVDGYGRVYVGDFFNMQVFDSNGAYINFISGSFDGIAFDQQNHLYGALSNDNVVEKYQIQPPAQP